MKQPPPSVAISTPQLQEKKEYTRVDSQPNGSVSLPQRTLDVIRSHADSFLDVIAERERMGPNATVLGLRGHMAAVASAAVIHFSEDMGLNHCAICGDGLSTSTTTTCAECDSITAGRVQDEMFTRGWEAAMKQAREVFARHDWDGRVEEILAVLDAVHEQE